MTAFHPENHGTGIVHIGPGAFHRAHQAVYTEDAMRAEGGDWRIAGVSLCSTATADALNAQNGRYTLVIRGQNGPECRVIETISEVLAAVRDLTPVRTVLAREATRIVSLTVTEKAYHDTGDTNVIDLLVEALATRRMAGLPPFTLLSCDNLAHNGAVLRKAVLSRTADPALADWIAEHARFPATMVDRITPASTPALLDEVAEQTGWADRAPVETEAFSQWVIEDNFVDGRPAWEAAGVQLVADVAPYEKMKLRMLNGAHSMLAYAGHLSGKTYVRDVMADPALSALVARHMDAAARTLDPTAGLDPAGYRDALLDRFRNPHIAHETYQIAMDGSQKMPQRVFAPALEAAEQGHNLDTFAFATAAWAQYLHGRTDAGNPYALRDPREDDLSTLPDTPEDRVAALFALPDLVPPALATNAEFRRATVAWLQTMAKGGAGAAINADNTGR